MSDKEKMRKAFQSLKAPEDTLERVRKQIEMKQKETYGKHAEPGRCGKHRWMPAAVVLLVLVLGCGSVYAAKHFSLGSLFGQSASGQSEQKEQTEQTEPAEQAGINTADDFRISIPFGYQNPYTETTASHTGMDFIADEGTPVLAAASGTVRCVDFSAEWGNYLILDHEEGYSTLYACLKETTVSAGDEAEAGTQIGTVGKSGMAAGPHLHLELWLNEQPIDPSTYLP